MFWHSRSTLFKGSISFKVWCREASFTWLKTWIGFGGNLALADWRERLLSRPWGWRDSSATISANMEQATNIQEKRVVYSILTVRHMVNDLYVNKYASDQTTPTSTLTYSAHRRGGGNVSHYPTYWLSVARQAVVTGGFSYHAGC
jgi:hypothetical protein